MSSEFGNMLRVSVFGESHGEAIGVNIDGLPAGFEIDFEKLDAFMDRRRAKSNISTPRREGDKPRFISGIKDGKTTGFPLCAVIENENKRSEDYESIAVTPRPSHADYTAFIKYGGKADMRGGGHFSGRLTAPLCIAGGIALQILKEHGVYIGAHLKSVAGVRDESFPMDITPVSLLRPGEKSFPVISDAAGEKMREAILKAAAEDDSVGGIIECAAIGCPAGLGAPMFDGVENRLAANIFGIPAVKGIEFGAGFAAAEMLGSECNDPFKVERGSIVTETNNSGGIQGGITNGMPIVLRVAIKPTPSIGKAQKTVEVRSKTAAEIKIKGRHDPCIAHRAVPVVEAVCALTILDLLLEEGKI